MGGTMTITLSVVVRPPNDIHTARQTKTLHSTERKKSWTVGKAALAAAMASAVLPTAPPAESVLARQKHKDSRTQGADDITDVDQHPGAQQRSQGDAPAGVGDDHQRIAGEELGAANDHQDETEREDEPGEKARDSPREPLGAGEHDGHEDRAERDEGACKHAQDDEGQRIAPGLGGACGLAGERHLGRQHGVDAMAAASFLKCLGHLAHT